MQSADAPRPGAPACLLIVQFLSFRDQDQILQKFRSQGPWQFGNVSITAYPDYTMAVQQKRASFVKIKQLLRNTTSRTHYCSRHVSGWWMERRHTSSLQKRMHELGCMPKDWFHRKQTQPNPMTGLHPKHGARKYPESQSVRLESRQL
ncbi:hypothetical protein NDU88_001560 [Pleurodeles waltl]|uniref:Uncharacterized protein n=1 Tax=Pleurodeles waltl TaxID=8319 RepID=A0AAV7M5N4_PLEWA|nr:hypothetical protein NDU88_001560 [Pleurodeles waltl]